MRALLIIVFVLAATTRAHPCWEKPSELGTFLPLNECSTGKCFSNSATGEYGCVVGSKQFNCSAPNVTCCTEALCNEAAANRTFVESRVQCYRDNTWSVKRDRALEYTPERCWPNSRCKVHKLSCALAKTLNPDYTLCVKENEVVTYFAGCVMPDTPCTTFLSGAHNADETTCCTPTADFTQCAGAWMTPANSDALIKAGVLDAQHSFAATSAAARGLSKWWQLF